MTDDKEHPGLWPFDSEFDATDEDAAVMVDVADVLATREFITAILQERDSALSGYRELSKILDRVEAENRSLRGNIKKLSDKLGYRS